MALFEKQRRPDEQQMLNRSPLFYLRFFLFIIKVKRGTFKNISSPSHIYSVVYMHQNNKLV
ncbi:hypothetical protein BSG1_21045 [Bacillus sp. SG-1]|nr:hypothetical protein BSG1_21045 [Bacillus sp. SG-1]